MNITNQANQVHCSLIIYKNLKDPFVAAYCRILSLCSNLYKHFNPLNSLAEIGSVSYSP